jgi:hypothetical protein
MKLKQIIIKRRKKKKSLKLLKLKIVFGGEMRA